MQPTRTLNLALQRFNQDPGKHGSSILAAFAVTDKHLVSRKIHIFDAQAQALHQSHSGSVQKIGNQPRPPIHEPQQGRDLVA